MAVLLIAEDDEDIATVLARVCKRAGLTVLRAADGQTALEMIIAERPDALLKSALEKIVYFEARAEQLHHELSSTREELEHLRRELTLSEQRELELRREVAQLEVRTGRLGTEREELGRLNQALRTERGQLASRMRRCSCR